MLDIFEPRSRDVRFKDWGPSLANVGRYGGRSAFHYSVAQHCYLLSIAVPENLARSAMLHDCGEGYMGFDVPRPIKRRIPELETMEEPITRAVYDHYGVDWADYEALMPYDSRICIDEMRVLKPGADPKLPGLEPLQILIDEWSPRLAQSMYFNRFISLFGAGAVRE